MGSYSSHETFLSVNSDDNDGKSYSAKFENGYFAEGACRYAFFGLLSGNGKRNGQKCVAKVFKKQYAKNFIMWAPDLAASKKANGFAQEFRRNYAHKIKHFIQGNIEIEFLIPLIAKIETVSSFWLLWLIPTGSDDRFVKPNTYVAIEPYIPGNYDKFNSNGGYEQNIHELLTAFCHWTWYISGHKYMVCDLQGVYSKGKYILTDPAIHSYDQQFGPTDLGTLGMEKVLGNHKCNAICRVLGLDNPMKNVYVRPGQRPTTYSFQVTEEMLLRKAQGGKSNYFKFLDPIFE